MSDNNLDPDLEALVGDIAARAFELAQRRERRDMFAAAALAGLIANGNDLSWVAQYAYGQADMMMTLSDRSAAADAETYNE